MLPDDVFLHILSFLPIRDLVPLDRYTLPLFRSNIVWQPRCEVGSSNCFGELRWQAMRDRRILRYKQQWTLGCLGRAEEEPGRPALL